MSLLCFQYLAHACTRYSDFHKLKTYQNRIKTPSFAASCIKTPGRPDIASFTVQALSRFPLHYIQQAVKRSPGAPLELELGGSRRLRIPCGVDAATLRTVLTVLGEQP